MRPSILTPCLLVLSVCSQATAQQAFLFDMGNGNLIGFVMIDGRMIVLTNITIFKLQPPTPPRPIAVKALLVYETGDQDQELNQLIIAIRKNTDLTRKLLILDKDAETADNEPLPLMQAALEQIGDAPLPRVVAFSADGSAVASEPVPETVEDVASILARWGL